jgi:hypothetical protein
VHARAVGSCRRCDGYDQYICIIEISTTVYFGTTTTLIEYKVSEICEGIEHHQVVIASSQGIQHSPKSSRLLLISECFGHSQVLEWVWQQQLLVLARLFPGFSTLNSLILTHRMIH